MWEILRFILKATAKTVQYGGRFAGPVAKKGAVFLSNESYEVAYGFMRRGPRYFPLGRGSEVISGTVWFSTRAGMQVRNLVNSGVASIPRAASLLTFGGVKYIVRTATRDVLLPYYKTVHAYQFVRADRVARGLTSGVERALDSGVIRSGRVLNRVGLAPSLPGTVASIGRVALVGTIYSHWDAIAERVRSVPLAVEEVQGGVSRARAVILTQPTPLVPEPVVSRLPVSLSPATSPATRPTSAPIPLAPPVVSRGGVREVPQPVTSRRR